MQPFFTSPINSSFHFIPGPPLTCTVPLPGCGEARQRERLAATRQRTHRLELGGRRAWRAGRVPGGKRVQSALSPITLCTSLFQHLRQRPDQGLCKADRHCARKASTTTTEKALLVWGLRTLHGPWSMRWAKTCPLRLAHRTCYFWCIEMLCPSTKQ